MSTARPLQLTFSRPEMGAKAAATALVPVVSTPRESRAQPVPSPDPSFVAQLIANAARLADRRRWPRDRGADARDAYARRGGAADAGAQTRQTV